MTALRLAERADLPLAGVVPIAPAGLEMPRWFDIIERDPVVRRLLALPLPIAPAVLRAMVGEVYRQLAFARPRAAEAAVVAAFAAHHASREARRRAARLGAAAAARARRRRRSTSTRVECPVLLVWGTRDRMVPHAGAQILLDALPEHAGRAARGRRALPAARGGRAAARAAAAVPRRGRRGGVIPLSPARRSRTRPPTSTTAMLGEGLADLRRMPSTVIDEGPQRTRPPLPPGRGRLAHAAAARAARAARAAAGRARDLLRPAARLLGRRAPRARAGRPTYLVDYGEIEFADRELGLEHWIEEVVPGAIRAASEDAGGRPVQVVGWCLGGILSLLALAADPELPVASVALIASPFDFSKVPLVAPLRPIAAVTGGAGITQLYRLLGGAPAPLVKRGYQLAGIDKYLMKPWTVLSNLHDRELLAQIEAVDAFMDRMHAYPGRTFGQLYHRFFRTNDLADGALRGDAAATLDLADVRVPVLSVAGRGDGIAPVAACHHVESLLPQRARSSSPPRRAATSAC